MRLFRRSKQGMTRKGVKREERALRAATDALTWEPRFPQLDWSRVWLILARRGGGLTLGLLLGLAGCSVSFESECACEADGTVKWAKGTAKAVEACAAACRKEPA